MFWRDEFDQNLDFQNSHRKYAVATMAAEDLQLKSNNLKTNDVYAKHGVLMIMMMILMAIEI